MIETIEVFRDSFAGYNKSPSRRAFGLDPATNKIVVPIDLCTFVLDDSGAGLGPDPGLIASVIGADIKRSSNGEMLGTVQSVDTPSPAINVNPFVILDRTFKGFYKIDQIAIDSVNVGDRVTIGGTTFSGTISALLSTLAFPNDPSLTISAFTVKLSEPIGSRFQGSPILAASGQTIGMLLGKGSTVIACPFP